MAYAKIKMVNPETLEERDMPIGLSWLYFFGAVGSIGKNAADWINSAPAPALLLLSIVLLLIAFNINNFRITKLKNKGFVVSEVLTLEGSQYDLLDNNPINYSESYKKYYVWVSICEIKYMKYFKTLEEAANFIKAKPKQDMNHGFIYRALNRLGLTADATFCSKYELPLDKWKSKYI
ncbi:hypothetical protein [Thalassotalea ganghwensis]